MCQFFDKHGYPVSVVQAVHHRAQKINRQSALQTAEKENTDRIPFTLTFHPHNHAVKSIILKNFKLLQNDSETGTIFSQHILFHSNVKKKLATFWSEAHFKPMANLELSNALAHDAKLVFSFITWRKYRDSRDPLRLLITYVYLRQCHLLHNLHLLQ